MSNLIGSNVLGNDSITQGNFKINIEAFRQFIENCLGTDSDLAESTIKHDNTTSLLTATNLKGAIDELASEKLNKDFSAVPDKVAPVGADSIIINDSQDSNNIKEVSLTNLGNIIPKQIVLSGLASYHLLQGNLSVSNEVITNGFSTTLYTGNGTTQSVNTGIDMSTQWGNDVSETFGGLVWLKSRSVTGSNLLIDTSRGVSSNIYTNTTDAQSTSVAISSLSSSGFSLGTTSLNTNLATYASWNFQTTHRRTGVTNHGKAYTEQYNPFTGFTIIKYEGSGIAGHEIPHHLGIKLGFATFKNLTSADYWKVATEYGSGFLEQNLALVNSWGVTAISGADKVVLPFFNVLSNDINYSSQQYIMYGWANSYYDEADKLIGNYEVGVYQGTGVAGNKVTTRGKPAWIMCKRLDGTGNWHILDNKRNEYSGVYDSILFPNASAIESVGSDFITFNVNGFTFNSGAGAYINASGGQYLYMVVYDNDSGSGKSKYPKATDTSNVQINNAIIPLANGIDSNGSKNSIVVANETITGLTLTEGKNYPYSKNDGTYGVSKYEPRYLSSELVRRFAGEQPDYFDVNSNKWFNTDAGSELVTNGKFDSGVTTGWTAYSSVISIVNNTLQIIPNASVEGGAYTTITTVIGKKYTLIGSIIQDASSYAKIRIGTIAGSDNIASTAAGVNKHTLSFIAESTTTYVAVHVGGGNQQNTKADNISVFPTDITPITEITESRNYLNHIVHADHNGQITYVEELPKIEYKDVIKANEYQGKNACTFYANIDMATTPPTVRESYNLATIIRTGNGYLDIYFDDKMDYNSYSIVCATNDLLFLRDEGGASRQLNKVSLVVATTGGTPTNADNLSIAIFGGRN